MRKTTHPPDNTHHRHGRSPSPRGGRQVPQRSLCELVRLLCNPHPSQGKARYINPEFEVINLLNSDIITNSGTETTQIENGDGIWDLNQNA